MPTHDTKTYNTNLQQMMENLRASIANAINNHFAENSKIIPNETVEEAIEDIPEQQETNVSWLNRPRVRTHGFFTNLSTSGHVTIKNDGGEIN